jgi:hypothetical protein
LEQVYDVLSQISPNLVALFTAAKFAVVVTGKETMLLPEPRPVGGTPRAQQLDNQGQYGEHEGRQVATGDRSGITGTVARATPEIYCIFSNCRFLLGCKFFCNLYF